MAGPLTIGALQRRCYRQAKENGWTDVPIPIPEMLALLHSEVSEALESYRNKEPLSWTDPEGKPQGIASEFADLLIRLGHYCELLNIDLEVEVLNKLAYNATRPHRHGGKLC